MPRKRDGITMLDVWAAKGRREGKRWLARVRDRRRHAYKNKAFEDYDEGFAWATDEAAKMTLRLSSAGKLLLSSVAEDFALELERRKRGERHRAEVQAILASAVEAGVADLKADDLRSAVRRWLATKELRALSERSRNKYLGTLHSAVKYALGENQLTVDPLAGMKGETEAGKAKVREVFNPDELRLMVADEAAGDPIWPLAVAMVYLGLRIGEAHALRWSWFDWKGGSLRVTQEDDFSPKRHQERRVPLMAELVDLLKPLGHAGGYVVPRGEKTTTALRTRQFMAYLARRGVVADGRGAHCVRHTWVSLRLALGVPSLTVQRDAGHRTILTTEKYAHQIAAGWIAGWPRGEQGEFWLRRPVPQLANQDRSAQ